MTPDGPFDTTGDAIPAATLLRLVRDVWNPLEAKVVIAAAALGAVDAPVAEADLVSHDALRRGARRDGSDRDVVERITEALDIASVRGTLLRLVDEQGQHWVLLGTEDNQRKIRSAAVSPAERPPGWRQGLKLERPGIFTLYEQNIGLITPIIADRLVEAIERFPERWIEEAITEAVSYNRRSWRYVERILENWATEGRTDETYRGNSARDLNREKHLRGKYAHLFKRGEVPDL